MVAALGVEARAALGPSVTLEWNRNPDFYIGGYRLYYGFSPEQLNFRIDLPRTTRATVDLPAGGEDYYFAISAITSNGLESPKSEVVIFNAPGDPRPVTTLLRPVQTLEDTPVLIEWPADAPNPSEWTVVQRPERGTLELRAEGMRYSPFPDDFGIDGFRLARFGRPESITMMVGSVGINAVQDAPEATDGEYTTSWDKAIPIALQGSDPEDDPITFQITRPPTSGTLVGTPPDLIYQPADGFIGTAEFAFVTRDPFAASPEAIVRVEVKHPNRAPVLTGFTLTTIEDTTIPVSVEATDLDGGELIYGVVSGPLNGSLIGEPPAQLYRPATNFVGVDRIEYVVNDDGGLSATAVVEIEVTPVNDPPEATPFTIEAVAGVATPIVFEGLDVDGDPVTYTVRSNPLHGTVTGPTPQWLYTAEPDYEGNDVFTFVASDGLLESAPARVIITVVAPPPAPPEVSVVMRSADRLELQWTVQPGRVYRVWFRAVAEGDEWQALGTVVAELEPTLTWTVDLDAEAVGGFYRIEVLD